MSNSYGKVKHPIIYIQNVFAFFGEDIFLPVNLNLNTLVLTAR